MRLTTAAAAPLCAIAAALAFAACSSTTGGDACGSGTPPNVAGTYKLASCTLGTSTVDTASGASGQLRFYAVNYAFNVTIPASGSFADSGTYVISGVRCMSETSTSGSSSSGTFSLTGTSPGSIFTFAGTNTVVGAIGFVAVKQ